MTEQHHQPPPLDLDAIKLHADPWNGQLVDTVRALVAELRAQRAAVAALTAERDDNVRAFLAAEEGRLVELDALRAERDAARAALAPLLDEPFRYADPIVCCFCGTMLVDRRHTPDCPVLRRDALLGQPPEEERR